MNSLNGRKSKYWLNALQRVELHNYGRICAMQCSATKANLVASLTIRMAVEMDMSATSATFGITMHPVPRPIGPPKESDQGTSGASTRSCIPTCRRSRSWRHTRSWQRGVLTCVACCEPWFPTLTTCWKSRAMLKQRARNPQTNLVHPDCSQQPRCLGHLGSKALLVQSFPCDSTS